MTTSLDMRITIGRNEEVLRVLSADVYEPGVFAIAVLEGPRLADGSWSREEAERVTTSAPSRPLRKWKRR